MNMLSVSPAAAARCLTREDFKRIRDFLDHLRGLDFDPGCPGPAGVAGPVGRLPLPPSGGAPAVGGRLAGPQGAGHEDPTDNEGVRRLMQGISRAHGRGQWQAKPLTAEGLAAVKATASGRRSLGRGRVDVALLSVLRDGLLRRSEAAALTWGDVELRDHGTGLINPRWSKTDTGADGVTHSIGPQVAKPSRRSGPRRNCWTGTASSLVSHPGRSDGEYKPLPSRSPWRRLQRV